MENEPLVGSSNNNQYALKQGLNLSSSLGLEVRDETSFDRPKENIDRDTANFNRDHQYILSVTIPHYFTHGNHP